MANEKQLDLIARKALLKTLDRYINPMPNESGYEFLRGIATAITEIEDSPIVDAVEVVHGRWVDRWGGKYANPHYECSVCKKSALYVCKRDVLDNWLWLQDLTDYCPNCGAKMKGENENGVDD